MAKIDIKLNLAKHRMENRRLLHKAKDYAKKGAIGLALIGASLILTGAYSGDVRLVEDTYTVKNGDTLWTIGEEYLAKNTGTRRYILEFIEGIKELNPELVENKSRIYPGQKIRINYWVKEVN